MGERLEFFLPCVPPTTTHHHKRIVNAGRFARMADRPELNEAKHLLDSLLLSHRPSSPLKGPVSLALEFTWPWRKSEPKKRRALGRVPHTSRPDCSNLAKTIEDRLVSLCFLEDDNSVASLKVQKWWGDKPGIFVRLAEWETGGETP